MSRAAVLLRADLLRVARDPMFLVLIAIPIGVAAALRAGSAGALARLPPAVSPAAVADGITAGLLLLTPMMFGFVIGLMLLDERDEGVLTAVALTPVGRTGFLGYRMATPLAWSALAGALVVLLAGLTQVAPLQLASFALLAGLQAPLLALFLGAFAADKVRGMALAKVGTVLIGLGALAVLVPPPWQWLAAPSPHFWLVRLVLARGEVHYAAWFGAALAVHLAALWLLARAFRARID